MVWPQVGDKGVCVRARGRVQGCVGMLELGKTYTFSAIENTDWIKGVRLVELPTAGVAPFALSRFAPEPTAPKPVDEVK